MDCQNCYIIYIAEGSAIAFGIMWLFYRTTNLKQDLRSKAQQGRDKIGLLIPLVGCGAIPVWLVVTGLWVVLRVTKIIALPW
jgi:hypothetical protein